MRTVFLALSVMFAVAAGCGVDPPPPASQADELDSAAAIKCPLICNDDTFCNLPNGTCTAVCNACFCTIRGGTVTSNCSEAVSTPDVADDSLIGGGGGPCGNTVCGKGSYCCNASCNTCARLGDVCTEQICNPTD